MNRRIALFIFLTLWACSPDYSPKPTGYFYIHIDDHKYRLFSDCPQFEFNISTQVEVDKLTDFKTWTPNVKFDNKTVYQQWFNLIYPSLGAQLYCDYLPISSKNFAQISEECRKFAYLHVKKANAILTRNYANPEMRVYGLVYEIKGDVASPVQFVLTDSVKHFFRGALYFDNVSSQDSIAPVAEYIKEDIEMLIESFKWKK
ncbi:MAG: gliding motility protein GldD [Dysgonamonadaceae bacterium]|jgi:gliding motility-associated lipoprotein GldD|nr:gliding motility protein GldD [Dysgonamonadaceae bacterium]